MKKCEGMRKRIVVLGSAVVLASVSVSVAGCQVQAAGAETSEAAGNETAGNRAANEAAGGEAAGNGAVNGAAGAGETAVITIGTAQETETEPMPALEPRDETVYVQATSLNVRVKPGTDAEAVGRLRQGDAVKRTGYSEKWSRVVYQEKECYVASEYLTAQKPVVETEAAGESGTPASEAGEAAAGGKKVSLNSDWSYAGFSKISSGQAVLYRSEAADRRNRVVCVNAGHGTKGGSSVKTQCHPDGTPKVTGGTTGAGAVSAVAVSGGMTFADGTPESKVTLAMAKALKEKLLARGYDVLMIRESDDVQLDNVARTVLANNLADCHIALHWDSTAKDKGAFYMSVPDVASYRAMEPVASHWQQHHALGDSLIAGLKGAGVKIFSSGTMAMDLTQTSYSTVPSVDIELGDKASDHSAGTLDKLAAGLADGVELYFGKAAQ